MNLLKNCSYQIIVLMRNIFFLFGAHIKVTEKRTCNAYHLIKTSTGSQYAIFIHNHANFKWKKWPEYKTLLSHFHFT